MTNYLASAEVERTTSPATLAEGGGRATNERPDGQSGLDRQEITAEKESTLISSEKEPPSTPIPEEKPVPGPTTEMPSLATVNEKHPPTPEVQTPAKDVESSPVSKSSVNEEELQTKEPPQAVEAVKPPSEEQPPVVAEKGVMPAVEGDKPLPPGSAQEPSPEVVADKHRVIAEEQQAPVAAEEKHVATPPAKEPSPAEAEYLAPTGVKPPVVAEQEKPAVKEPKQAVEAEKLSEKPPAEEQPRVIVEEKAVSETEEKAPPSTLSPEEPPHAPVAEERDIVIVEKEIPPAEVEEEVPTTIPLKEAPADTTPVVLKEEEVGPLTMPDTLEEPTTLSEPLKEIIEEIKEIRPTWEIWHTDPAENVLFAIAIILIAGKICGETARLLRVPAVVGKIMIGMLLGNIYFLTGWDFFNFLRVMPFLKVLSDFGALTLLFTVGLHTDLKAMLQVGISAVLVSLGGMIAPAGLGFLAGHFLLPDASFDAKLLLSIILCATSMGVILNVLEEMKSLNTLEGRIVIGGAILSDTVTMLAFGVVCGVFTRERLPVLSVIITTGIIFLFLSAIIVANLKYSRGLGEFITRRFPEGLQTAIVAVICLLFAFLAESIGLHTIIGAFAAGLLLQNIRLRDPDNREYSIEWLIKPAYMLLVPILFVRAGAQVHWESFLDINTVFLGLAITGASVLGKLFCGLCPVDRGINRLVIGLAMIPKLEVTLVLASIGRSIGILDDAIFSSFMMLVVLSSTIAPPLLKLALTRKEVSIPERVFVSHAKEETRKAHERLRRLGLR